MDITKEHKEKICDTNKKVSYSQRGSISIKKADSDMLLDSNGIYFKVSKGELGAFFRNEEHPKYMECGDQILRNFLNGLVIHLRGPMPKKEVKKQ